MGIRDRGYMRDRSMFDDSGYDDSSEGVGFWQRPRAVWIACLCGVAGSLIAAYGLAVTTGRLLEESGGPTKRTETLAAQAAAGWALGGIALGLGIGLLIARRRIWWLAVGLGAASVLLGVVLEARR